MTIEKLEDGTYLAVSCDPQPKFAMGGDTIVEAVNKAQHAIQYYNANLEMYGDVYIGHGTERMVDLTFAHEKQKEREAISAQIFADAKVGKGT